MAALRAFGVEAFTAMLYPHKPGMAHSLNEWAAGLRRADPGLPAHRDVLRRAVGRGRRAPRRSARAPGSSSATSRWATSTRTTRCSTRRGASSPTPGVPVVTHCGSGPVPGRFTGPEPVARLLARHPRLRLVVAHLGMPEYAEFLDLAERHDHVHARHHDGVHAVIEKGGAPFPAAELPRLRDLGDRVLLGTDFPNIPYSYAGRARGPGDDRPRRRRGCARSATTTPPGCSPADLPAGPPGIGPPTSAGSPRLPPPLAIRAAATGGGGTLPCRHRRLPGRPRPRSAVDLPGDGASPWPSVAGSPSPLRLPRTRPPVAYGREGTSPAAASPAPPPGKSRITRSS